MLPGQQRHGLTDRYGFCFGRHSQQQQQQQPGTEATVVGSSQQVTDASMLQSTGNFLHKRFRNGTMPGSKLLFALASAADNLSPVQSSRASGFHSAEELSITEGPDSVTDKSSIAERSAQQLHKAYHGLTSMCRTFSRTADVPFDHEQPSKLADTQAADRTADDAPANKHPQDLHKQLPSGQLQSDHQSRQQSYTQGLQTGRHTPDTVVQLQHQQNLDNTLQEDKDRPSPEHQQADKDCIIAAAPRTDSVHPATCKEVQHRVPDAVALEASDKEAKETSRPTQHANQVHLQAHERSDCCNQCLTSQQLYQHSLSNVSCKPAQAPASLMYCYSCE